MIHLLLISLLICTDDVSELLRLNDLTEKLLEPLASATASLQS